MRFCWIDSPYWKAFYLYYYKLGVRLIHVCIQKNKDADILRSFAYPSDLRLVIHKVPNDVSPNDAWLKNNLSISDFQKITPYILVLDTDEFIKIYNPRIKIEKLMENYDCLYLWWIYNPIVCTNQPKSKGFLASKTGIKSLVRSDKVIGLDTCHSFQFNRPNEEINAGRSSHYGIFLIHNWSRSPADMLLKTLFSEIKDSKNIDQSVAIKLIKEGNLPIRAKFAIYLDLQIRYFDGLDNSYVSDFDTALENKILSSQIDENILTRYYDLFSNYRIMLSKKIHLFPSFPYPKGDLNFFIKTISKYL